MASPIEPVEPRRSWDELTVKERLALPPHEYHEYMVELGIAQKLAEEDARYEAARKHLARSIAPSRVDPLGLGGLILVVIAVVGVVIWIAGAWGEGTAGCPPGHEMVVKDGSWFGASKGAWDTSNDMVVSGDKEGFAMHLLSGEMVHLDAGTRVRVLKYAFSSTKVRRLDNLTVAYGAFTYLKPVA